MRRSVNSESPPVATVVIATKNRLGDLKRALASVVQQSVPLEVIVLDDGSTDGTSSFVAEHYPSIRLESCQVSQGYIVQRNRGAGLSTTPYVFSIDDDAEYPSLRTVEQTLRDFDDDRIGAVAMPFVDVLRSDAVRCVAPDAEGTYVTSMFIGTAYAVRRDLFVSLGGFCEAYYHQVEEQDFCMRLLAAGYVTRLGRADPIHHHESPIRSRARIQRQSAQNNLYFAWQHAPLPRLPVHWVGTLVALTRHWIAAPSANSIMPTLRGVAYGFTGPFNRLIHRRPVSDSTYRLYRNLRKRKMPLAEVEPLLKRIH